MDLKTGLVLEGGAMRGVFSAGIMDVMMENGVDFDGVIGISAGAAFGCNFKSRQIGDGVAAVFRQQFQSTLTGTEHPLPRSFKTVFAPGIPRTRFGRIGGLGNGFRAFGH